MEQLIELLQQIQDLAGVGIEELIIDGKCVVFLLCV